MTRATHLDRAILEAIARAIADEERRIKTTPEPRRQDRPFIRGAVQVGLTEDTTIDGSTDTTPDSSTSVVSFEIGDGGALTRKPFATVFNLAVNQVASDRYVLMSADRFGVLWAVAEST